MILYQYLINHHSNVCCLGYNYEETVYINYHLLSVFILHLFTNHTYMWTNRSGMQQTMMDQEEILYYRKSID